MIDSQTAAEMQTRLQRIETLAAEIEQVPNLGPDVWTMRKIDKKCQEIREHCKWIAGAVGTGNSSYTSTGSGTPSGDTGGTPGH